MPGSGSCRAAAPDRISIPTFHPKLGSGRFYRKKTAVGEEINLRQPPLVFILPGCEKPPVASQHRQLIAGATRAVYNVLT
jgi:hypothetical protein